MKNLKERAAKILAQYRSKDTVYFTSDGQAFLEKNPADNHAATLADKAITTVERDAADVAPATEEGATAPKPAAAKPTKAAKPAADKPAKAAKPAKTDAPPQTGTDDKQTDDQGTGGGEEQSALKGN